MYEKVAIITQICHRAKCNVISISKAWYLVNVPNMNKITTFFSEISQQICKIYEKMDILKFGTQYEENQSSYHEGMCEDENMDG